MTPGHELLKNLANLFKVKTIVTLAVVFVFCFKALQGIEITSEFVMIASAIITYYFTKGESSQNSNETTGEAGTAWKRKK